MKWAFSMRIFLKELGESLGKINTILSYVNKLDDGKEFKMMDKGKYWAIYWNVRER